MYGRSAFLPGRLRLFLEIKNLFGGAHHYRDEALGFLVRCERDGDGFADSKHGLAGYATDFCALHNHNQEPSWRHIGVALLRVPVCRRQNPTKAWTGSRGDVADSVGIVAADIL
jgi:hypothetical protein